MSDFIVKLENHLKITMHTIKSFANSVKISNFILNFICISGFCYQVHLILNQYMLGETVVNIVVKRITSQPLPAITVCKFISTLFSISKLSKLNEFNRELYQDYKKLLREGHIE